MGVFELKTAIASYFINKIGIQSWTQRNVEPVQSTSPLNHFMPESHERTLRRIIRRFGNFPTTTYSNRISSDVNVYITYGRRSECVLNLN